MMLLNYHIFIIMVCGSIPLFSKLGGKLLSPTENVCNFISIIPIHRLMCQRTTTYYSITSKKVIIVYKYIIVLGSIEK